MLPLREARVPSGAMLSPGHLAVDTLLPLVASLAACLVVQASASSPLTRHSVFTGNSGLSSASQRTPTLLPELPQPAASGPTGAPVHWAPRDYTLAWLPGWVVA